jgi:hypothetical protein
MREASKRVASELRGKVFNIEKVDLGRNYENIFPRNLGVLLNREKK